MLLFLLRLPLLLLLLLIFLASFAFAFGETIVIHASFSPFYINIGTSQDLHICFLKYIINAKSNMYKFIMLTFAEMCMCGFLGSYPLIGL